MLAEASDSGSDSLKASEVAAGREFTGVHLSPIGNLSPNVFVAIVRLTLDVDSSGYIHNSLQNLRLVSKRWYEVLDSTPYLWTTIHSTALPAWIAASLERSKSLPLTVRCALPPSLETSPSYTNLTTFLLPESRRWKRLGIALMGRLPAIDPLPFLQTYDMPDLDTLTVRGPGWETVPRNNFGGHPPRLCSVYLKNYSILWTSAILHSGTLQYLNLVGLTSSVPSSTALCNILANSPRLRTVEVGVVGRLVAPADMMDLTSSPDPVYLPDLARLSLDVAPRTLCRVLPRLQIPTCSRLKVGMRNLGSTSPIDTTSLSQHLASRLHTLAGNLIVKVVKSGRYCIIGRSGRMDLNPIRDPAILAKLLEVYNIQKPPSSALPSPITLMWSSLVADSNPPSLAVFCDDGAISRFISHIVISGIQARNQAVLRRLSVKSGGDTLSPAGWPFPNLVGVELTYYPEIAADILVFVEARCNGPTGQAVRLLLSSTEHRPDEQIQELIRTHELVDFEWKGVGVILATGLEV